MSPRERLFALEQFGVKLGLHNISALLNALGRPERAYPCVHIAGTNGKGSTSAMVERGLRAAGHRTGRYTSPHLIAIEERIAIDGTPVAAEVFDDLTARVLTAMGALLADGGLQHPATFFEATTAIAFEAFRGAGVTASVIEVGLGGRFDATNVVLPHVTAITSIAFDHEQHLGHSLAAIAFEKAGIIKRDVPLVVGSLPEDARQVVAEVAQQMNAPVTWAVASGSGEPVQLALHGAHQHQNAAVAVELLRICGGLGRTITRQHIATALTDVEWPARLEWLRIPGMGDVLIDAAHNPEGAAALAAYAATVGRMPMLIGVMRDKDVCAMARALAPAASRFVATTAPSARALEAHVLAAKLKDAAPMIEVEAIAAPDRALASALRDGGRAMAGGSIFLIGPLRAELLARGATTVRYPSSSAPFLLP